MTSSYQAGASRRALVAKHGSTPIANTLISKGIADATQIQTALETRRQTGRSLTSIIAEMTGKPLDPEIERQYKRQDLFELKVIYGLPTFDLDVDTIDTTDFVSLIQTYFTPELCQKYLFVPISTLEATKELRIAFVDPGNLEATDDVSKRLRIHDLKPKRLALTIDDFNRLMGLYLDWLAGKIAAESEAKAQAKKAADDEPLEIEDIDLGTIVDIEEDGGEGDLKDAVRNAEDAPIIKLANQILIKALQEGVSDIHIEPQENGLRIRFRKDGVLRQGFETLPKKVVPALTARFKILSDLDIAERKKPQDGRIRRQYNGRKVDFRVNSLPSRYGEKIVMRILDNSSTQLGLGQLVSDPETLANFRDIIQRPFGLILVTGPTGSGKTTTLYSALAERNDPGVNISTAEDPIEYTLEGVTQVQVIREKGMDFASILRAFLRQDPDVILVGETRDYETAKTAVEASMTGHLVLTTLHTNDAPSSIARLIEMGIEPFNITSSLIGIMAQRLIRRVCSECRIPYHPTQEELGRFGLVSNGDSQQFTFYRANSLTPSEAKEAKKAGTLCKKCGGGGYKGRCGVYELMRMNDRISELVNKEAPTELIKEAAIETGMKTLLSYGLELVQQGATTLDEISRVILTDKGLEAELKARAKSMNTCRTCNAELKPEWLDCPYCLTPRFAGSPPPEAEFEADGFEDMAEDEAALTSA